MKTTAFIFGVASLITNICFAQEFTDNARVTNVRPIIEKLNTPVESCRTEYRQVERYSDRQNGNYNDRNQDRNYAGSIVGGVVGGLLGSQVGGGNGKTVATAAGAIAGAMTGDSLQNNNTNNNYQARTSVSNEPYEVCSTTPSYHSRTSGYEVSYEYRGRTFVTTMTRDPGRTLPVSVAVRPFGGNDR